MCTESWRNTWGYQRTSLSEWNVQNSKRSSKQARRQHHASNKIRNEEKQQRYASQVISHQSACTVTEGSRAFVKARVHGETAHFGCVCCWCLFGRKQEINKQTWQFACFSVQECVICILDKGCSRSNDRPKTRNIRIIPQVFNQILMALAIKPIKQDVASGWSQCTTQAK